MPPTGSRCPHRSPPPPYPMMLLRLRPLSGWQRPDCSLGSQPCSPTAWPMSPYSALEDGMGSWPEAHPVEEASHSPSTILSWPAGAAALAAASTRHPQPPQPLTGSTTTSQTPKQPGTVFCWENTQFYKIPEAAGRWPFRGASRPGSSAAGHPGHGRGTGRPAWKL